MSFCVESQVSTIVELFTAHFAGKFLIGNFVMSLCNMFIKSSNASECWITLQALKKAIARVCVSYFIVVLLVMHKRDHRLIKPSTAVKMTLERSLWWMLVIFVIKQSRELLKLFGTSIDRTEMQIRVGMALVHMLPEVGTSFEALITFVNCANIFAYI